MDDDKEQCESIGEKNGSTVRCNKPNEGGSMKCEYCGGDVEADDNKPICRECAPDRSLIQEA